MAQAGLALYQAAPRAASPYKTLDPTKHFDLWLNVQGANKRIADGVYLVSNQESPIVQTNVKTEGDSGYYGGMTFGVPSGWPSDKPATPEDLRDYYATTLELWVPYLYFNDQGGMASTQYFTDWVHTPL